MIVDGVKVNFFAENDSVKDIVLNSVVFFRFFSVIPTISRANEIPCYPAYTFKLFSACSVADIDKITVASLDVDTFDGQRSAFANESEIISRLVACGVVNARETYLYAVNNHKQSLPQLNFFIVRQIERANRERNIDIFFAITLGDRLNEFVF